MAAPPSLPPRPGLPRRAALAGACAGAALAAAGLALGRRAAGSVPRKGEGAPPGAIPLVAAPRRVRFPGAAGPSEVWSYGEGAAPPVLRARRGEPFRVRLENRLPEPTAVHWHGVRVPNAMDGVPHVTQPPVSPGGAFDVAFVPPDAGTFFFHPHCNSAEQLGRGLLGVLLVDDPDDPPFDLDLALAYKEWALGPDGSLGPFLTAGGAARGGTFGTLPTVNGTPDAVLEVPPGADLRLRFLNLDGSRVLDLALEGAGTAWVIATDGNTVPPFPLEGWRLGPAMRVDVALRTPAEPGAEVTLRNNFAAKPVRLARLRVAEGAAPAGRPPFEPRPLAGPGLPEPDLAAAEVLRVTLGTAAAPSAAALPADVRLPNGEVLALADGLCVGPTTLWALNRRAWPDRGHAGVLPPPLATLARGRSVVLDLDNTSKVTHPMHLHGHTFKVLGGSKLDLPPHWADTTLVHPGERRRVAFVADNPGDWMLHCHVIEHQETGMMGILRVT